MNLSGRRIRLWCYVNNVIIGDRPHTLTLNDNEFLNKNMEGYFNFLPNEIEVKHCVCGLTNILIKLVLVFFNLGYCYILKGSVS